MKLAVEVVRDDDQQEILGLYEAEEWLRMGEAIESRNQMLDNKRRYQKRTADRTKATRRLSELRGLGNEIWQGIDAQVQIDQMRDEWDQPG